MLSAVCEMHVQAALGVLGPPRRCAVPDRPTLFSRTVQEPREFTEITLSVSAQTTRWAPSLLLQKTEGRRRWPGCTSTDWFCLDCAVWRPAPYIVAESALHVPSGARAAALATAAALVVVAGGDDTATTTVTTAFAVAAVAAAHPCCHDPDAAATTACDVAASALRRRRCRSRRLLAAPIAAAARATAPNRAARAAQAACVVPTAALATTATTSVAAAAVLCGGSVCVSEVKLLNIV